MPAKSEEPLRKVTLNLFDADVAFLQRIHADGYTMVIRDAVHDLVRGEKKKFNTHQCEPFLLGDLDDD